jgi:hypothetical protein
MNEIAQQARQRRPSAAAGFVQNSSALPAALGRLRLSLAAQAIMEVTRSVLNPLMQNIFAADIMARELAYGRYRKSTLG